MHYLSETISRFFFINVLWDISITIWREKNPIETGSGVKNIAFIEVRHHYEVLLKYENEKNTIFTTNLMF